MQSLSDFDAILLISFGGPEAPEEVVPFLEVVTAGQGIPRERLEEVGEHYYQFGGKSPINDQAKALKAALETELAGRGRTIPILWGNRNWHPFLTDTLREAIAEGHKKFLVVTTSAYPSFSGCRSYRESVASSLIELDELDNPALSFVRIGNYALDEAFVAANAQAVSEKLAISPDARVVFVTHSIPIAMNDASGPQDTGAYVDWHEQVATRICDQLGVTDHDLTYCSRSGPPTQPWLEPDINDHLEQLAAQGVKSVVVSPIGFISDHMEVIFDLDTEAKETAEELGMEFHRADTVGVRPGFVSGLVDRMDLAASGASLQVLGCGGQDSCCINLRNPGKPAIA